MNCGPAKIIWIPGIFLSKLARFDWGNNLRSIDDDFVVASAKLTDFDLFEAFTSNSFIRLPTPLWRTLSMTITNSCAAGRERPRTNNQSKHIHAKFPGDRVYGQTALKISNS